MEPVNAQPRFSRKPRPVFRIAVTGPIAISNPELARQFAAVLDEAQHAVSLPTDVVVVCCLAGGTDQTAASVALERGHRVWGIVPSRIDSYRSRMGAEDAVHFSQIAPLVEVLLELDLPLPSGGQPADVQQRQRAYDAANIVMLQHADMLIHVAVPGAGQQRGGAASVVERARSSGLPIVEIAMHSGAVQHARGSVEKIIHDTHAPHVLGLDLTKQLEDEVAPESRWAGRRAAVVWKTLVWESLDKAPLPKHRWLLRAPAALLFFALSALQRAPVMLGRMIRPTPFDAAAGPNDSFGRLLEARFNSFRTPVSRLADYYNGLHRTAFFVMSATGVVAVLVALAVPALSDDQEHHLTVSQSRLVVLEAGLIALMIALFWIHNHFRWQQRGIDYRLIAERLRHAQVLALLARSPMPYGPGSAHWEPVDPRLSWAERYSKGVIRDIGLSPLTHTCFDAVYLSQCRQYLVDRWIEPQIRYHANNHWRAERLHIVLECLAVLSVMTTLVVCALHFVPLPDWTHKWMHLPAGVLPALAAACHGIDRQADLERIGLRSHAMKSRLVEISNLMSSMPNDYTELASLAERAADVMLAEAGDWRVLFQTHPVPPPH